MVDKVLRIMANIAIILASVVVMLGAYTRLTDAGLGCPDWPGCYGHLVLPAKALLPVESTKAWTEMIHRYAAGTLGLLIGLLAFTRLCLTRQGIFLPIFLLSLLVFQALLGMWTVTMKLLPLVVMGHLLGGMLIFSCLCILRLQLSNKPLPVIQGSSWYIKLAFILVFLQIALGGWVSSNYAGIACIGFPQCNGQWFPHMNWLQGFNMVQQLQALGVNYQGGLLDVDAKMAIQYAHRIGALVVTVFLTIIAAILIYRPPYRFIRCLAIVMLILVFTQISLGILNVMYLLPLSISVAHNGVALLLLATVSLLAYCYGRSDHG